MKSYLTVILLSFVFLKTYATEEKDHGHVHQKHEEHSHSEGMKEEHEHDEAKEEAGHSHDEAEEESSSIGPDKGITAKSEEGFKLSPESVKTMELNTFTITNGPIRILQKALVKTKGEKSVFRLRHGWYKRVKVEIISKNKDSIIIKSSHLKPGDQLVVTNVGFLRIAEVFSEEGAEHSHAH